MLVTEFHYVSPHQILSTRGAESVRRNESCFSVIRLGNHVQREASKVQECPTEWAKHPVRGRLRRCLSSAENTARRNPPSRSRWRLDIDRKFVQLTKIDVVVRRNMRLLLQHLKNIRTRNAYFQRKPDPRFHIQHLLEDSHMRFILTRAVQTLENRRPVHFFQTLRFPRVLPRPLKA